MVPVFAAQTPQEFPTLEGAPVLVETMKKILHDNLGAWITYEKINNKNKGGKTPFVGFGEPLSVALRRILDEKTEDTGAGDVYAKIWNVAAPQLGMDGATHPLGLVPLLCLRVAALYMRLWVTDGEVPPAAAAPVMLDIMDIDTFDSGALPLPPPPATQTPPPVSHVRLAKIWASWYPITTPVVMALWEEHRRQLQTTPPRNVAECRDAMFSFFKAYIGHIMANYEARVAEQQKEAAAKQHKDAPPPITVPAFDKVSNEALMDLCWYVTSELFAACFEGVNVAEAPPPGWHDWLNHA